MSRFEITGGVPLRGTVRASGSKNAALPIMAAAILADAPVRLSRVPRLTDVRTLAHVLAELGLAITPTEETECDGALEIKTVDRRPVQASEKWVRRMRASFCVAGPLLARRGRAMVPLPGGCAIGDRPVDLHLRGFAALGADIRVEHGCAVATARRLTGAEIDMAGPRGPTVTGTANVLSAAVLARGVTVLHGAATEPEIVDLGRFLIALGAKIEGLGTPTIRIKGVEQLGGTSHRLIPDRIEAATLLMAAAVTGGSATVTDVVPGHLKAVLDLLEAAGVEVTAGVDRVSAASHFRLRSVNMTAAPYPGVPTDVQAQWTALSAVSDGTARIEDRVFPCRFQHVAELNRLGANIVCEPGAAVVRGVARLSGARVAACDLRASAALVLAGLAAEGRTTIDRAQHLARGYERLDLKLRRLGANIESDRIQTPI